jgi:hypothetical protein
MQACSVNRLRGLIVEIFNFRSYVIKGSGRLSVETPGSLYIRIPLPNGSNPEFM